MPMRLTRPVLARLLAGAAIIGAACTTQVATPTPSVGEPGTVPAAGAADTPLFEMVEAPDAAAGKPGRWASKPLVAESTLQAGQFEFEGGLTAPDGSMASRGIGTVAIAGAGEHSILWEEIDHPLMSDAFDVVTVTDKATENKRTYGADQGFQQYFVQDGGARLDIAIDPAGGWLVGGQAAPDVQEAARLAMRSPVVQDASLHGLTALYGVLRHRPKEGTSRATIGCDGFACGPEPPDPALLVKAVIDLWTAGELEPTPEPVRDEPFSGGPLVCPPEGSEWDVWQ